MKANFDLTPGQRKKLLDSLLEELENYYHHTENLRVTPELDLKKIVDAVRIFDLQHP